MTNELRRPVRVAAVGLESVTQNRHLKVMHRNDRFDVARVIDRHDGLAAEVARRRGYRFSARATGLGTVEWLDEVDAVTAGTAPFPHQGIASQALALGKHVLTEKPFAMSRDERADLVGMADPAARYRGHGPGAARQ